MYFLAETRTSKRLLANSFVFFLMAILGCSVAFGGPVMPEFALEDVNSTSSTFGQPVSPRDYLEQVSGWYFGHAT